MLTASTRKIVEGALNRPLHPEEEAGYPALSALPDEVIVAAKTIRAASNLVAVSVYLQHVVPSVPLDDIKSFIDEVIEGGEPPR
jgi:hypothetical protein